MKKNKNKWKLILALYVVSVVMLAILHMRNRGPNRFTLSVPV